MAEIQVLRTDDESLQFYTRDGVNDWSMNKYNFTNNDVIVGRNIDYSSGGYLEIPAFYPSLRAITINTIFSLIINAEFHICDFAGSPSPSDNVGISFRYYNNNVYIKCSEWISPITAITYWSISYPWVPELNTKYQFTLSWDGTTVVDGVNFYINGELVTSTNAASIPTALNSSHPLRMGADSFVGINTNGYHHKLEIYDEEKSAGWVDLNYRMESKYF